MLLKNSLCNGNFLLFYKIISTLARLIFTGSYNKCSYHTLLFSFGSRFGQIRHKKAPHIRGSSSHGARGISLIIYKELRFGSMFCRHKIRDKDRAFCLCFLKVFCFTLIAVQNNQHTVSSYFPL